MRKSYVKLNQGHTKSLAEKLALEKCMFFQMFERKQFFGKYFFSSIYYIWTNTGSINISSKETTSTSENYFRVLQFFGRV